MPGIAARVISWQRRDGRHGLPWQGSRDPYRVWLSEIMLQQTQVTTVLGYYERFLRRFPDVQVLAASPLDDVLAAWSGLGYYSRARNLWRCAQQVVRDHGGQFPSRAEVLAELPGIGRSTAAAIAAFCFGERAAILDGNVKRVLARHLGFDRDLAEAAAVNALWQRAETLLPGTDVDVYTQGLMDLGATVCTRRDPHCLVCPLASDCAARQQGDPTRFPIKTRKLKRSRRSHAWLWLERGQQVWLVKRPDTGVWAGLHGLPELPDARSLLAWLGPWAAHTAKLPTIEHALTHFDWTLVPMRCRLVGRLTARERAEWDKRLTADFGEGRWWSYAEARDLALPAPLKRLLFQADPDRAPT